MAVKVSAGNVKFGAVFGSGLTWFGSVQYIGKQQIPWRLLE